jgi:hypothetical protein
VPRILLSDGTEPVAEETPDATEDGGSTPGEATSVDESAGD